MDGWSNPSPQPWKELTGEAELGLIPVPGAPPDPPEGILRGSLSFLPDDPSLGSAGGTPGCGAAPKAGTNPIKAAGKAGKGSRDIPALGSRRNSAPWQLPKGSSSCSCSEESKSSL